MSKLQVSRPQEGWTLQPRDSIKQRPAPMVRAVGVWLVEPTAAQGESWTENPAW